MVITDLSFGQSLPDFTYVKNFDHKQTGNVSGLLLYAKTDEEYTPDSEYVISGNQFAIKTLDLGSDWEAIEQQLRRIAEFFIDSDVPENNKVFVEQKVYCHG